MITTKFDYTPIPRETIDGIRHYHLPDGSKVPSVTTILDKTSPPEKTIALANWRKSIGEKQAKIIVTEAANRGTRMHTYLENYIKTEEMSPFPSNPFAQPSWFMAAEVILAGLPNINEVWGVEVPVYYSGLYAGTSDCIGTWKGKPAILDFKQSNKVKKDEHLADYRTQLAAYAMAHNNMFGTNIETGIILMCVKPESESAKPQYLEFVLEGDNFQHYSEKWMARVEQFYNIC